MLQHHCPRCARRSRGRGSTRSTRRRSPMHVVGGRSRVVARQLAARHPLGRHLPRRAGDGRDWEGAVEPGGRRKACHNNDQCIASASSFYEDTFAHSPTSGHQRRVGDHNEPGLGLWTTDQDWAPRIACSWINEVAAGGDDPGGGPGWCARPAGPAAAPARLPPRRPPPPPPPRRARASLASRPLAHPHQVRRRPATTHGGRMLTASRRGTGGRRELPRVRVRAAGRRAVGVRRHLPRVQRRAHRQVRRRDAARFGPLRRNWSVKAGLDRSSRCAGGRSRSSSIFSPRVDCQVQLQEFADLLGAADAAGIDILKVMTCGLENVGDCNTLAPPAAVRRTLKASRVRAQPVR